MGSLEQLGQDTDAPDERLEAFWEAASNAVYSTKLESLPAVAALLATRGAERGRLLRQCAELFPCVTEMAGDDAEGRLLSELFRALAAAENLTLEADDLIAIVRANGGKSWGGPPIAVVLDLLERRYAQQEMPSELAAVCRELVEAFDGYGAEARKLNERVERLLKPAADRDRFVLTRADAWSDELCNLLAELSEPERRAFHELLEAVRHPSGSKPSGKWLKSSGQLVEAIGRERFVGYVLRLLAKVGVDGGVPVLVHAWDGGWTHGEPTLVSPVHAELLKGLIWAAAPVADSLLVQGFGDVAERCFKKVAAVGPRAPKIGNACLAALTLARAPNAVSQLSRLQGRVKHSSSRAQVERALTRVAEERGVSRDTLEDLSVPSCGLTEVGRLERKLGDFTAMVELTGARDFELYWLSSTGKRQTSVPAAVRTEHAEELKGLKASLKELEQQLPTQLHRLEAMLLSQRSLSLAELRQRFLTHPLLGYLTRRLLWRIGDSKLCGLVGDQLVDSDDSPIDAPETTQVTLWHPMLSSVAEVQTWREWLERHEITQPFKQAHREVYLLTDAERQTRTYSNRFAAHVLKQHQFSALCRERGWRYHLQGGGFDSHNTPRLELPAHDFCVEYYADGVEGELSDASIFLYIATDQVRFMRLGETEPIELAQVPPLLFSEVMRDIDLFVGVCSVGNDPNWRDQGQLVQYHGYWETYAFGALGETAKTRREALARLIPRLKIAEACRLEERFLVVRGHHRTYRIHLGSANIQMDPNSQYLCIVPSRNSTPDKVMLPFEGDATLSLILSKALLLANDHEIADPSIRSQIGLEHYRN